MKKNEMRLSFCRGDVCVIVFVAMFAIGIGVWFAMNVMSQKGSMVTVYQEGEMIRELPLSEDAQMQIENQYTNKIVVKNQKVAIVESDCPGMDCVHSGWISTRGRSLVCLPNRIEIRIEGESEVDFIVR